MPVPNLDTVRPGHANKAVEAGVHTSFVHSSIIQPNIQINGSNIEFVNNFVFLGITINNKLNWNSHINKVTNKISKTVGILNKLRSFLPSGVLQTIYNTLILPHMIMEY